jgi:hypothetical protein
MNAVVGRYPGPQWSVHSDLVTGSGAPAGLPS